MKVRRLTDRLGILLAAGLLLILPQIPARGQDSPPAFATNTPQPTAVLPLLPDAPFEQYALRRWDEASLVQLLFAQVRALKPGASEGERAISLIQYELAQRFPGAPRSLSTREQLIAAMMNAPRGSIDKRAAVRPFVEALLNVLRPSFDSTNTIEAGGFSLTFTPANVDGVGGRDAVIQTRYPAGATSDADLLYHDYTMAHIDPQGAYRLLESTPSYPAAPFGEIESVRLERAADLNQDGLDELAISTQQGSVNQTLMIFGWRGGGIVSLVQPGQAIQFGQLVDWPLDGSAVTVREYRVESPAWNCLGERDLTWAWHRNFFRPPNQADSYTFQNRLACLLYGSEPFFDTSPQQAIDTIETILLLAQPEDESTAQRAAMIVAMLHLLDGDDEAAMVQAQQLQTVAAPGSWLAEQTAAFVQTMMQPGATPVQVCAALQSASQYGACDVDQVLTRLFTDQPLRRDQPIEAQLSALGITVLDSLTIAEVGKLDRQAFHFNLAGDRWWSFAPLRRDEYVAEKMDRPASFVLPSPVLPERVAAPEAAYDALLVEDDPADALTVLANVMRDNPDVPFSGEVRFLLALAYDLLGDRTAARKAYFDLWKAETGSIWGQLAAAHLEKRV